MNIGEKIQIEGRFGFLQDPELEVLDIHNTLVLVQPIGLGEGGLLSGANKTWVSVDILCGLIK